MCEGHGTHNPYGGADQCKFGQPLPHQRANCVVADVPAEATRNWKPFGA